MECQVERLSTLLHGLADRGGDFAYDRDKLVHLARQCVIMLNVVVESRRIVHIERAVELGHKTDLPFAFHELVLTERGDSGEAERSFRKEAERHSGMIPNTFGA
jgi:hypothetical protein